MKNHQSNSIPMLTLMRVNFKQLRQINREV